MKTQTKPGQPDPLAPAFAGLAVLIGGSLLGVITWLVITYEAAAYVIIAVLSCLGSLAVVGLCLWLVIRGNWRARLLAAVLFAGMLWLVTEVAR